MIRKFVAVVGATLVLAGLGSAAPASARDYLSEPGKIEHPNMRF